MDISVIIFIAFGLAMDAFAVSIASGAIAQKHKIRRALTLGIMFGAFQMFMPVIGFLAATGFHRQITAIDHWIAFGLLLAIGLKMIYEAMRLEKFEQAAPEMTFAVIIGLSIATSIDALAVGISFAFLNIAIVLPVMVIGAVTFIMSFSGVLIGQRFGGLFEKKFEILGGLVLIGIGVKILIEHL